MSNDTPFKSAFDTAVTDFNAAVTDKTAPAAQPKSSRVADYSAGQVNLTPAQKASGDGEFYKGFSRSFAEVPGLIAGMGAYAADVFGADNARDTMLQFAKDRQQQVEEQYGSDAASFSNVLNGDANAFDFLKNSSGYVVGQALQSILTGGVGAAVVKGMAKGGIVAAGEKFAADQLAKGATAEVAKKSTEEFLKAEAAKAGIKGFTLASGAQNLNMEIGSIYPDAVEQAQKEGRTLDGGDRFRVGASGAAAAATDTAMDRLALGKVMGGSKASGSIYGRAAREIPVGMGREAFTEGVQTELERYGAGKSLTDAEAMRDVIDSAAVGAIGGAQAGILTAVRKKADEPNSPLSRAAIAGNAGVLDQATNASSGATPAATPPGVDQTQTGSADPISQRVQSVVQTLESTDTLQKLRDLGPQMGAENLTSDFLYALQVARDSRNRPDVRQQAMEQVEQAMQWATTGFTMPQEQPQQPGTAVALRENNAVGPVGQAQFFDPNTIDGEAVRVDNMIGGPRALTGPQRGLATQPAPQSTEQAAAPAPEVAQNEQAAFVAPNEQQNVATPNTVVQAQRAASLDGMAEVQAPRVAIPAGTGPAVLRKRGAVVKQLAENGFETVQRDGKDFFMVNSKTGQKFKLDGPADAQLARKAINDRIDALAHTAAASPKNNLTEPTQAQIDAGNYKKSDVINLNGMQIKIENPQGSIRRGVGPDGTPWETKMAHHYGEFQGTVGADGDKLDVFLGPRKDSDKIYVIDQVNKDGSFDEHKVMMGFTTADAAREGYLANYDKGWTGLGAMTEMSPDEFKTWAKSRAAKKPASSVLKNAAAAGQDQFTAEEKAESAAPKFFYVDDGTKKHKLKVIKPGEMPKKISAERTGERRPLSQADASLIEKIAGVLGKNVVFFEAQNGRLSDGFVRSGQPNTIYVATETTVNPLAVFGHEFFHTLRETNPSAWDAVAAVVNSKVTAKQLFRTDRYGKKTAAERGDAELSTEVGGELEELVSDLGGNLLKDAKFWKEVFARIEADNGAEAKGIIAKLSAAIQAAITRIVKAMNQPGFRADSFVKDLDQVRSAFKDAMALHLKDSGISQRAMAAEELKAKQSIKKSEDRADKPEGLTVEGYHFSKEARPVLSTGMFGTGLKGSARDEIMNAADARIRQRLSFYVNKGTGINPEAGVGGIAHKATLTNIYDADADPLRLRTGDARAFESKVLDAGYSGYLNRLGGTQSGQVILLGNQTIRPEVLGPRTRIDDAKPVPGAQQRDMDLGDKIAANKALPSGMLSPSRWSEVLMQQMPAEAAQLMDIGAFEGDKGLYKDELVSKIRGLTGQIKKSADRAQSEYAEVEAKYKGTDAWMKAPDGTATKLTERQWVQTRTPSFKKWFGDWEAAHANGGVWAVEDVSKAVGENGEPLVVYHGTDKGGFTEFEAPGGTGRGDLGIWTTPDYGMAKSYVRKGRARDVDLSTPTQSELEEIGYEFFGLTDDDDAPEGQYYNEPNGDRNGPFETEQEAIADAATSFEGESGTQPGIYALFINVRNPNEENFEGAMWNGEREDQYQVRDENDDPIYDDKGRGYFDLDTANALAEQNPGAEVQPADSHYQTTDDVVRDALRNDNDGAIIREVIDDGGGVGYWLDPQDIFVAFDPSQLKSADYNNGEFNDSTGDLRKSADRKQIPESVDDVTAVEPSFEFAASEVFPTNRDFKLELQKRARDAAKAAKVTLDGRDERTENYLVRVGEKDARAGLKLNSNAVGWYNEKVSKALAIVSLIHPELKTNPEARFAFTWALAVTSNGMKVNKNFELAEMVYEHYKRTGRMPIDIKAGTTQGAINDSLALFNELRKAWGIEPLMDFMTTKESVKSIEKSSGVSISGEGQNTQVYGAAILGPKIGNGFFMNLYGQFDQLTMDRWLMRTWGRWTGTLVEIDKANIKKKREQLDGLIRLMPTAERKEFERIIGSRLTLGNIDKAAELIKKASAKPALRERMNALAPLSAELRDSLDELLGKAKKNAKRESIGSEMRKVGNSLFGYLDGQKEAPAGSVERDFIRKVFGRILASLKADMPDLTMADLQAVVWYPEKRLYDAAKANEETESGYSDDEAPDYANAAADLASQKGIPADKIAEVTKEIDDEISAAKRARNAGRGDLEPEQAGQTAGAQTAESTQAGGLPDSDRVRRSPERVANESGSDQGSRGRQKDGSLSGLPREVTVAGKKLPASHWAPAEEVARQYMADAGLPYNPPAKYVKVDPAFATRIAAEYDKLKHDPQNPEVKAAYAALVKETAAQYQAVVDSGLVVEFIDFAKQGDPYEASPRLMTEDVRDNNHMWVFSTRDGFGSDAEFDPVDNPLLAETDFVISGKKALVNDLFRVVHDYFGHVKEGVGFRADGEENTWRAHSAMFSPLAQRALTTETRGQNSWVNYGPHGENNRKASAGDTRYADQKVGLLPEWVSEDGKTDEPTYNQRVAALKDLISCLKK
jgi:hypothetical protein